MAKIILGHRKMDMKNPAQTEYFWKQNIWHTWQLESSNGAIIAESFNCFTTIRGARQSAIRALKSMHDTSLDKIF